MCVAMGGQGPKVWERVGKDKETGVGVGKTNGRGEYRINEKKGWRRAT